MHTAFRRHRHLVAAPLAAMLFMFAFLAEGTLQAASLEPLLESTAFLPYEGARIDYSFDPPLLDVGSVLINTTGKASLQAGEVRVTGLAGAFHITRSGEHLTIAALTTPVLLRHGDAQLLVLAGRQWRGSTLAEGNMQPLPAEFVREQLRLLADRRGDRSPEKNVTSLPSRSALTSLMPFQAAQARAEEAWREEALSALRSLVEARDSVALRRMLSEPTFEAVLTPSPLLREIIPSLLADAREDPGVVMELLPLAEGDEELLLLASLHPELRSAAWMGSIPRMLQGEARRMLMFALPESDIVPEGIPGFVIERWGLELREELVGEEDPLVLFRTLVAVLRPLLKRAQEQGYPERVQNYVRVLTMVASSLRLPPDLAQEIANLKKLSELSPKIQTAKHAIGQMSSGSSISSTSSMYFEELPPHEVEARASQALLDAGALFTVHTRIRAVSPGVAKVDSIVFPSLAGDRILDFELDVLRGEVRSISDGGRFLPYAVPLSAFAAWAKGS